MDEAAILSRVDGLMAQAATEGSRGGMGLAELFHGTLSVASVVYGPESVQTKALLAVAPTVGKGSGASWAAAGGLLSAVRADLEGGLVGSLRLGITGGVIADFVQLSRETLGESGDQGKNVAAVLAAAAYEDTIRRMGSELAEVHDRRKLSAVLEALKQSGSLAEAQFTIAQGYLKFRNDALHAGWDKIERESVASVLGFVEELVLKHFS